MEIKERSSLVKEFEREVDQIHSSFTSTFKNEEKDRLFKKICGLSILLKNNFEEFIDLSLDNLKAVNDCMGEEAEFRETGLVSVSERSNSHDIKANTVNYEIRSKSFKTSRMEKDLVLTNIIKNIRNSISKIPQKQQKKRCNKEINSLMVQLDSLLLNLNGSNKKNSFSIAAQNLPKKRKGTSKSTQNRKRTIKKSPGDFYAQVNNPTTSLLMGLAGQTGITNSVYNTEKSKFDGFKRKTVNFSKTNGFKRSSQTKGEIFDNNRKSLKQTKRLLNYITNINKEEKNENFDKNYYFDTKKLKNDRFENSLPTSPRLRQSVQQEAKSIQIQQVFDLRAFKDLVVENEGLKSKNKNLKAKYDKRKEYINKMYEIVKIQDNDISSEKQNHIVYSKELVTNILNQVELVKVGFQNKMNGLEQRISTFKNDLSEVLLPNLNYNKQKVNNLSKEGQLVRNVYDESNSALNSVKRHLEKFLGKKIENQKNLGRLVSELILKIKVVKKENSGFEEQLSVLRQRGEKLKENLARFSESLEEREKELTAVKKDRDLVYNENTRLKEDIGELDLAVDDLSDQRAVLENKEIVGKILKTGFSFFGNSFKIPKELKIYIQECDSDIENLKDCEFVCVIKEKLKSELRDFVKKFNFKGELEKFSLMIRNIKAKKNQLVDSYKELNEKNGQLENELVELEKSCGKKDKLISERNLAVDGYVKEIDKLKKRIIEEEVVRTEFLHFRSDMLLTVDALKSDMDDKEEEISSLREEIKEKQKTIESLEKVETEFKQQKTKNQELNTTVNNFSDQVDSFDKKLKSSNKEKNDLKEEIVNLEKNLNSVEIEKNELEKKFEDFKVHCVYESERSEKRIELLDAGKEELASRLKEVYVTNDLKMEDLTVENKNLQQENNDYQLSQKNYKEQIDSLTLQLSTSKTNYLNYLTKSKNKLLGFNKNFENLKNRNSEIEFSKKFSGLNSKLDFIKQLLNIKIMDSKVTIDSLTEIDVGNKGYIEELKFTIDEKEKIINDLKNEINAKKFEIDNLNSNNTILADISKTNEENNKNQEESFKNLKEKLEELDIRNGKLVVENEELGSMNITIIEKNEQLSQKNEELGSMNITIIEKNEQLSQKNEELGSMNITIIEKNEQLSQKNEELGSMNITIIEKNEQLSQKNEELGSMNITIIEKNEKLSQSIDDLIKENNDLKSENRNLAEAIETNKETSTDTKEDFIKLQIELNTLKSNYNENCQKNQKNEEIIEKLELDKKRFLMKEIMLDEEKNKLEEEKCVLKGKLDTIEQESYTYKEELTTYQQKINSLSADLEEKTKQISKTNKLIKEKTQKNNEKLKIIKSLKKEIEELTNELNTKETSFKANSAAMEGLEEKNAKLEKDNSNFSSKIKELEDKVNIFIETNDILMNDNEFQKSDNKRLSLEKADLSSKLTESVSEIKELIAEIENLSEKIEDLNLTIEKDREDNYSEEFKIQLNLLKEHNELNEQTISGLESLVNQKEAKINELEEIIKTEIERPSRKIKKSQNMKIFQNLKNDFKMLKKTKSSLILNDQFINTKETIEEIIKNLENNTYESEISKNLDFLQSFYIELKQEKIDLDNRFGAFMVKVDGLLDDSNKNQDELDDLKNERDLLLNKIEDEQLDAENIKSESKELKSQLEQIIKEQTIKLRRWKESGEKPVDLAFIISHIFKSSRKNSFSTFFNFLKEKTLKQKNSDFKRKIEKMKSKILNLTEQLLFIENKRAELESELDRELSTSNILQTVNSMNIKKPKPAPLIKVNTKPVVEKKVLKTKKIIDRISFLVELLKTHFKIKLAFNFKEDELFFPFIEQLKFCMREKSEELDFLNQTKVDYKKLLDEKCREHYDLQTLYQKSLKSSDLDLSAIKESLKEKIMLFYQNEELKLNDIEELKTSNAEGLTPTNRTCQAPKKINSEKMSYSLCQLKYDFLESNEKILILTDLKKNLQNEIFELKKEKEEIRNDSVIVRREFEEYKKTNQLNGADLIKEHLSSSLFQFLVFYLKGDEKEAVLLLSVFANHLGLAEVEKEKLESYFKMLKPKKKGVYNYFK